MFDPDKTRMIGLPCGENMLSRFHLIPERDGRTDRRTELLYQYRDFRSISRFISETIQDRAIVTIEGEWETVPKLSNGANFNELE